MDTYIKQCDCEEIQDVAPFEPGTRIWRWYHQGGGPAGIDIVEDIGEGGPYGRNKAELKEEGSVILPRQKDWQNILFREHYAPAVPTAIKIHIATIIMHREVIDYMEGWGINQPCEAWARLFMNFHDKRWTDEGWV